MENQHVCPWWLGYTFLIPIRKYQHNPAKILGPFVKENMKVLDYGCAMGYFSLPLARMIGTGGMVYCVDIQQKMIDHLMRRASRADLAERIQPLLAGKNFNPDELTNKIDFVLLFAVVHEVPDRKKLFNDIYTILNIKGKVLFCEPSGHVSKEAFAESVQYAKEAGLSISDDLPPLKKLSIVLEKKND